MVARYVKVVHLQRPGMLFGKAQPAASTLSSSAPLLAAARPAQPVHSIRPRPIVLGSVQHVAPVSSTSSQPATTQPVQQGHTSFPKSESLSPVRPDPPKPVAPWGVQPTVPSSSIGFPPAPPGQPPLRGLTFAAQPAIPIPSTGLPATVGAASISQCSATKNAVFGGAQSVTSSSTPSLRPTPAVYVQPGPHLPRVHHNISC